MSPSKRFRPRDTPRNRRIALRVIVGWETYDTVAKDYGICRERVRQIVNRYDPDHQRPTIGRATLIEPNSDPTEVSQGRLRNRPLYLGGLGKEWKRRQKETGRRRRLELIEITTTLAAKLGRMPTTIELNAAGAFQEAIARCFSGVRRWHTAIRRLCRLIGQKPRHTGRQRGGLDG